MGSKRRGPPKAPGCPKWGPPHLGGIRPQGQRPMRGRGQAPRPHHRPRHANNYNSNTQWNRDGNPPFGPRIPALWNRSVAPPNNGSGTSNNFQPGINSNYQYSRYAIRNAPYQHPQNPTPFPWNMRPQPLLPLPLASPMQHPALPLYDAQATDNQTFDKPLDKTITDTIDQVKRKLKERKLSESQKEKINCVAESSSEENSNNKISERKRIEHVKTSPKVSVAKKVFRKEDTKNVSSTITEKSDQQQKSQTLRKNILKQLFKLDKNNLQQILSDPEPSNKYSCALSSLIKDTRTSISKELRNVAEKSLQFHNISANSEQGEKIVQDAFLGHLGTMLDTSSSLELFNLDPQFVTELSKALQQDLMGSINDVCLENLRDVMHESIMEEAKDDKLPTENVNVDHLNIDFENLKEITMKEIDFNPSEKACTTFSSFIKIENEKRDADYKDQSISADLFNHSKPTPLVEQACTDFEKRLQSIKIENNKIEVGNFFPVTSSNTSCSQNFKENTSPGKSDDSFREQILRNFDIATNKYGTGACSSNKTKKRKHSETNSSSESRKETTEKSKYFNDNSTISLAPEKNLAMEMKTNVISSCPPVELVNHKTKNATTCIKMEPIHVYDSNIQNFSKEIIELSQNKNPLSNHLNSTQNVSNFCDKIVKNEFKSNNIYESKEGKSSILFKDPNTHESHFTNTIQNNLSNKNKIPVTTTVQNIENTNNNSTSQKLQKIQTDIKKPEKYINHRTSEKYSKFKNNRSDRNNSSIDRSKTKNLVTSSHANVTKHEKKEEKNCTRVENCKGVETSKSPQTENQTDKINTNANDLSTITKVEECVQDKNKNSLPKTNMKNQGTQYIDFRKTNASTQIYASLISSKFKGCQTYKINMKDVHCQTSVHISEQDVSKIREFKETVNKGCQVDSISESNKVNVPKNLVSVETQTSNSHKDIHSITSKNKNQNDALSRMKLIDNEIHQLLQERCELYKSLESTSHLNDNNAGKLNFKLRSIPNMSDCKSNLDSEIKKYNAKVKNLLHHSIEKPSTVDNNSISNSSSCNKPVTHKSKRFRSMHSTNDKSVKKLKKPSHNGASSVNVNDVPNKLHKSDKIKEQKDNVCNTNIKEVTSESADKRKLLVVDNSCNSSNLELRNNLPCNKMRNESLISFNHQNTLIINKKINSKDSFHNKIVCKRKPRSINEINDKSKSFSKKTPLSTLISELKDSDDEVDIFDVKNSCKENKNGSEINISKENPITNLKKKYNLKNCSVKLEPVNVRKSYSKENVNSQSDIDQAHEKMSPHLSTSSFSISLDDIDAFGNLTDPDIPNMLENIGGNETLALVDNWDSHLFDNVTLSETVFGDEENSSEITVVTSDSVDFYLMENEEVPKITEEAKSDIDNGESLSENIISLSDHTDSIMAIECVGNTFLAASLDGNVYYYCANTGILLRKFYCSELAITCLWVKENTVYTGSFDANLKCFDLDRGEEISNCNVGGAIQSMTSAWNTIYIGTKTGFVVQYDITSKSLVPDGAIKFSDQTILAINAIKEGPRKVLLIASRSQDVTVKDAKTGLLLRTFHGPNTTIYSLLFNSGKVFCGTSSSQIQSFDFVTGELVKLYVGGNGAVCLKLHNGLLFAGCYDGFIYVFKPDDEKPFASIPGPGKMLLAMAILGNKIIAGCKDKSLRIWNIPKLIIDEMIF